MKQVLLIMQTFSFPKASLQFPVQSKSTSICKCSLKGHVNVFKCTVIWYKVFNKVKKT